MVRKKPQNIAFNAEIVSHDMVRRDAATHGIRYDIETTESLTLPDSWEIVSLEDDGIDIVDAEFETVTHRLNLSGKAREFIRLSIGEL